jgi:hypothetical protein
VKAARFYILQVRIALALLVDRLPGATK